MTKTEQEEALEKEIAELKVKFAKSEETSKAKEKSLRFSYLEAIKRKIPDFKETDEDTSESLFNVLRGVNGVPVPEVIVKNSGAKVNPIGDTSDKNKEDIQFGTFNHPYDEDNEVDDGDIGGQV